MNPVFLALLLVTVLFGIFLLLKSLLKLKLCVICTAVFLSWVVLLILLKTEKLNEPIIISILMGQSVTGVFYLAKNKLKGSLQVFVLPTILSLTYSAFVVLAWEVEVLSLLLLTLLWSVSGLIYTLRNKSSAMRKIAEKIITCCRDW